MNLKKIVPLLFVGMLTVFAQAAQADEEPFLDQIFGGVASDVNSVSGLLGTVLTDIGL